MTTATRPKPASKKTIRSKPKPSPSLKFFLGCLMAPILLVAIYVVSVLWRVSVYEQKVFGRSDLIPMSLHPRSFTDFPTMDTYGAFTFNIEVNGKPMRVHKQVINGFQHVFGSALVAYECGEAFSDLIFRGNEYMEAYLTIDGRRMAHYLDTKKDLYNNIIGRAIGMEARQKRLSGIAAERYIAARVLNSIQDGAVIPHWMEPEVRDLPSLDDYGCPGLPHPLK